MFEKPNRFGSIKILVLGVLLFFSLSGQSTERLKKAFNNYLKTGDENHLRFQLIQEINFPDFPSGGLFLKAQNHNRANQIMIEVLRAYNRYDLVEQIFFANPGDEIYRARYKNLYYLSLLNNLKTEELFHILLSRMEEVNRQLTDRWNKNKQADLKEAITTVRLELFFLQEVARKQERQLPTLEKIIRSYPFSDPVEPKRETIFNHLYSGLDKKTILKKVYDSLLSRPLPPPPAVKKPEPKPEVDPDFLNSADNFFDLKPEANPDFLNSADSFFDLEEKPSQKNDPPKNNPSSSPRIDESGVLYSAIRERTDTSFLNLLYQKGYYLNYLHLYKKIASQHLPSAAYQEFSRNFQERLSRVLLYTQEPITNLTTPLSPEMQLKQLFYANDYQKIIDGFKQYQQSDFYLLSLAAMGKWDTVFGITQQHPDMSDEYRMISLLVQSPDKLLSQLKAKPNQGLKAWQMDFLNLVEENLSPQMVATLLTDFLFKRKELFSRLDPKITLLYEYGITLQSQMLREAGQPEEVSRLFRAYYNRMQIPVLKEKLMFLHGMAYLGKDPAEGEKILYRLLALNPQSPYRFEIEEALNLLL